VIVYLDSSVLLRVVLGQTNALKEWRSIEQGVVSGIVEVECLRTLDRIRLTTRVGDKVIATRREAIFRLLETLEVVEARGSVLARAAQPLPTVLGTLDAIHLSTALLWRESTETDLVMATHDEALALAAKASGLRVVGI
jgi:predicted nucleic acid-binding protein